MAFGGKKTDASRVVPAKKRGAQKKDKTFTTVWAQYSGKTKEGVNKALDELIGRYGDGDLVPMPRKDYSASANWSVENPTDWTSEEVGLADIPSSSDEEKKDLAYFEKKKAKIAKALAKEEVILNVKCGGQYRMEFFAVDGKDGLQKTLKVKSTEAVAEMKEIKAMLDGMKKSDGDLGTYFHETAIALAKKAAKKGKAEYIEKWDCMVEPSEMEQAEKFFSN